jgi:hypothetical protein
LAAIIARVPEIRLKFCIEPAEKQVWSAACLAGWAKNRPQRNGKARALPSTAFRKFHD